MPVPRSDEGAAVGPLTDQDAVILLHGPWRAGLTLWAPEANHDRLCALWARHETELRRRAQELGIAEAWFERRDLFVRTVRGE